MWRTLMIFGMLSCAKDHTGLTEEGLLKLCPKSPNCVCSNPKEDKDHSIAPIAISEDITEDHMDKATSIIQKMGGVIVSQTRTYCHAQFTSKWLKFIDDFEVLLLPTDKTLEIKSSSQVGYSDLGANRKRAVIFTNRWTKTDN